MLAAASAWVAAQFAKLTTRGIAILIGCLAVLAVIVAGYFYLTGLQKDLAELTDKTAKYEAALETEKKTIAELQQNGERMVAQAEANQRASDAIARGQQATQKQVDDLTNIFRKHDLPALAAKKPGLLKKRIDAGTASAFDRLSRASVTRHQNDSGSSPNAAPVQPAAAGAAQPAVAH